MLHQSEQEKRLIWRIRGRDLEFGTRGIIMGVLNVTVDSFSDGGKFLSVKQAVAHGRQMVSAGAEIIDVGGESTRPGAEPVEEEEELRRVIPVIRELRSHSPCTISVDTYKPAVAAAAVEAGAAIINDVTGFRDPRMIEVARQTGAGLVVMHMQGTPRDMQKEPRYGDVVAEVGKFFLQAMERLVECGIDPLAVAFDPGIGFGKTLEHNVALLNHIATLTVDDRPVVVGVSRKSFLGKLLGETAMESRKWPTVALTSFLRERGARVFRVHDVRENVQSLRMTEAIMGETGARG